MKQPKVKVKRTTISLPEPIYNYLTKQATKKLRKPATYFAELLREFAEVDKKGGA